jgi:tRNA 2-thiouridine synthesizing protein A
VKIMANVILNAVGKKCPMPVLMTKKELKNMNSGQTLELLVDDKGALKDVPALLSKSGDELLETKETNGQIRFIIKKS